MCPGVSVHENATVRNDNYPSAWLSTRVVFPPFFSLQYVSFSFSLASLNYYSGHVSWTFFNFLLTLSKKYSNGRISLFHSSAEHATENFFSYFFSSLSFFTLFFFFFFSPVHGNKAVAARVHGKNKESDKKRIVENSRESAAQESIVTL